MSEEEIPEHLRKFPGLTVRADGELVRAPAADVEVAQSYVNFEPKGTVTNGLRLTILTRSKQVAVDEEVRVIHVFEAVGAGHDVMVMGPKPVIGEFLDGQRQANPEVSPVYDGPVLASPAVDYNYDITTYSFSTPGLHGIVWILDGLESNTLWIFVGRDENAI